MNQTFKVYLRDRNPELVQAWQEEFREFPEFQAEEGDIFGVEADAVISPANSYGFMDGGIDLYYSEAYGWQLQRRLQQIIKEHFDGEVLVGQALVFPSLPPSGKTLPRYLICAPTMRVPTNIFNTEHAYLAFRAALLAVRAHNLSSEDKILSIACPGLGTGVGGMNKKVCAAQMRRAWQNLVRPEFPVSWLDARDQHDKLLLGQL
jgi:O-acetyl-ADP-ribose deacetylase (regulator of RNase III)